MKLIRSLRPVHLSVLAIGVFGLAFALVALSPPKKASADTCSINGRNCYFGYFTNVYDGGPGIRRNNVLTAPALSFINNIDNLVVTYSADLGNCPGGGLWNQNDQNAVGAAFTILTMLGAPPGTPKNEACRRFAEWRDLVYSYEAAGLVNINIVQDFGGINTRSTKVDVAYYPSNGAAASIVFYHPITRQPIYAIKRDCGNPIGVLQGLPVIPYNIQPTINVTVNSAAPSGAAEVGDTITFDYRLINTMPFASPGVFCSQYGNTHSGYYQHPNPNAPEPGGIPGFTFCPQIIPGGGNNQARPPEVVVVVSGDQTICRMLYVWPASRAGETKGYEVCVAVAQKPYLKVYGGDVSVGGGLASAGTCPSSNSGAVSWNQKTAGHPGAGTQFAALVRGLIREFATAQGNAGGAPAGAGLAFANTVNNPGAGQYGGNFGTASCIKDFYSEYTGGAPATPSNVSSMNPLTPVYATTGNLTLGGGNINPNQRTTVYVDGDLYINGNITYVGSWNTGSMPMFKVVVRGNIFIDNDVTRIDGIYIAQQNGANTGSIYTCTTSSAVPILSNGQFFNNCNRKLTVNGAFIANSVEFLRTNGTQHNSTANEPNSSGNIAEVFNYGPAFWIPQPAPTGGGGANNYDAITSLPPVL
jgi:hypothetical protein